MGNRKVKIRDLELIHATLEDEIADARLLAGPWYPSRIPPEILCEIFHRYILFFQHSAWTISQVCRAWRRIVLGCPSLWNRLHVTARALQLSNGYRSRNSFGRECLTTPLQALRAIRRTREAPLSVELWLNEGSSSPDIILRLLNIVAGENLSRWRTFEWYDSEIGDRWTPVLRQALLPVRKMTSLKRLSFHYNVCHMLIPALDAGVPSLVSLEMTLDNGDPPTMLMTQPWLRHLKNLTLRKCYRLGPLWPFIAECKALEDLKLQKAIYSPGPGESFELSERNTLPRRLRTVRLETHANFWPCVSGRNITSLTLQMSTISLKTVLLAPRSISLPSLTELSCLSYQTAFAAGHLLDAPTTQSMEISNYTSTSIRFQDPICAGLWDDPWGIHPIRVSLTTCNQDARLLQNLFLRFTKVNTLSLRIYFRSVGALLALITDINSGDDIKACPNLTRMECEFMDGLPRSEASRIDSIIQAIQDQREKMGLLRPKIVIWWEKFVVSA